MEVIKEIIDVCLNLLQTPITLYDKYTFSFWGIITWSLIASIVVGFIFRLFGGGDD